MSQRPADEFNESEVLPGVYLTDFRPPKNTSATPETLAVLGNPRNNIEVLKLDIQEIENSLFHLRRSNKELAEAAETDDDPDILIEAIRENEVVIDKKELQLLELTETLKMLAPHYS